ncbi:unnamed protein product [Penicillium salamii]|uniref:Amidase domain-containing protein n=1 Tax=Penicillium salamii TaxID=1612424 RepID=A0A9W4JBV7_9EURO|nr:unnamed protein product [Penicillium salamii]CAG7984534.1 unnamed protein product [Penicillium salamii]CAG8020295.1 unnamed protein product [Penicillium salamii]CAG8029659.1 unnamed protein product [Penicillium salamii]CAG8078730.1 unnamed protein product [Penicillium salamii]
MSFDWSKRGADKRIRLFHSIPEEWKLRTYYRRESNVFNIPTECGKLSAEELSITNSTASDLVEKLSRGELKAVDVTVAFCKRTTVAHQLVRCFHEFFPEKAIAQAKELDEYFEIHQKPIGPLHGLPISINDQFRIEGQEASMGRIAWLGKYDTTESTLITLLRKAGAVLYTKTSVCQTLLSGETCNNIIAVTSNPRNNAWSAGGSSGGGRCFDRTPRFSTWGGSVRVPAAFNFLYGIKPSQGRTPHSKMANSVEGQETAHSIIGPIAHTAADLRLFLKAVLSQEPWNYDPKVIPLPWRSSEEDIARSKVAGRLTLGYFYSDGVVNPYPPILRGIDEAVAKLRENGHTLIPWRPYKHAYAQRFVRIMYTADGNTGILNSLKASGELVIPYNKRLLRSTKGHLNANQLGEVQLKQWEYQRKYLERWRRFEEETGTELDAIIAPVAATAAIRHGKFRYYGYSSVISLLDFTSAVAEYDPEVYDGAPVGLQVIGRRLSEERILVIAEEIGRLLGNSQTP